MDHFQLLARGNAAINQWLSEHPLVLGSVFLALGLIIGGWGIYELSTGVAHSKWGKEMVGAQARIMAVIRIVAGIGCLAFGMFKIIS